MPRPSVRRKVAQQNSKPTRVANSKGESPRAFLARQVEHKPIGRVSVASDESDEFVKVKKTPRNRRGVPPKDIFASGGLGSGDEKGYEKHQEAKKKRFSDGPLEGSELSGKKRKIGNGTEKDREAATQSSPASGTESSQHPSITSAQPKLSSVQRKPSSISGVAKPRQSPPSQGPLFGTGATSTPLMGDSVLANVRRRPRQPSIMSNLNLQDDNTLDDMDDLDDLEPNGESTPYETSKAISRPRSDSPKANTSDMDRSRQPPTLSSLSKARHNVKCSDISKTQPGEDSDSSDEQGDASSPQLPSTPRHSKEKGAIDRRDSDTFAPPQSSSPSQNEQTQKPSPQRKQKTIQSQPITKVKTREAGKQREAITARQPSTQALQKLMPQPLKGRRLRKRTEEDEFDIPEDSSDEFNENEANDDHDSSFAVTNRKRRQTQPIKKRNSVQPTSKRGKGTAVRQRGSIERSDGQRHRKANTTSTSPPNITPPPPHKATKQSSQQPSAQPKRRITYTSSHRRDGTSIVESDKENQPLDTLEDSSLVGGSKRAEIGGDVAQLQQKYNEVDAWSLTFEDVDQEGALSSPPDQR